MGNKITRKCLNIDEHYTRPQGLYSQRNVDKKKLRRLILNSKLAPCFPGEEEANVDFEECPICFLYYPSLNRSKCCSKGVCTECFLQMKSPPTARSTQCPFCKFHNYSVEYRGSKTLEEKGIEAVEEQKFIEAKIRMRKQEFLDGGRQEEFIQQKASNDEFTNETFEDVSKSNQAIHIEIPQQVKFIFDIEKWKQNLCEPNYCYDKQWLRKPCGPSLSAGPSSFRTCGSHCEPNCSKCLMTFHKRRVYDVLDVTTPQPIMLKTNQTEPFMGSWRSTRGNYQSLLSQSFPLPTRMPKYHFCNTKTLKPSTLEHHSHDIPSNLDGMFVCVDPKIQNTNNLTQESVASSMSPKSNLSHAMDSPWVCEECKSEGSLIPTPSSLFQDEQSTMPLLSSNKLCNNMECAMLKYEARLTPINNNQQRDDEFDLDLEEIMVTEAIWQSIQDQRTHFGDTIGKLPQMKTNQHIVMSTAFQVNNDLQEKSKVQCLHVESIGNDKHHQLTNKKARGLASAIATLIKKQAIKKQAIFKQLEFRKEVFSCVNEQINDDKLGELRSQLYNETSVRDDYKIESKDLLYKNYDEKKLFGDSGLHALTESLETYHGRTNCLESLANEIEQSEVFLKTCQNDQSLQKVEGASSSTHIAHLDSAIYVPHASSQNVRINRCECDTNRYEMLPRILPKSFEEQMMLAMALSITDAH